MVLDRVNAANASLVQTHWLGPAVNALERGTLASLSLLADGQGMAAAWNAQRPTWIRRAMAKLATRPFAAPMPEQDDA